MKRQLVFQCPSYILLNNMKQPVNLALNHQNYSVIITHLSSTIAAFLNFTTALHNATMLSFFFFFCYLGLIIT